MARAMKRFLLAADGPEMIAAVDEFPELLSTDAERFALRVAQLAREDNDLEWAADVDAQIELLRRARQVGIQKAILDEVLAPFRATMDAANAALNRHLQTGRAYLLDEAVEGWRSIVGHEYLTFMFPAFERWALRRAATAMVLLFRRDRRADWLDEAVALLDRAADLDEADDRDPVGLLRDLADAIALRYQVGRDTRDHARAVATYRAILARTSPSSPAHRAARDALSAMQASGAWG
jgi:hypothetical protein